MGYSAGSAKEILYLSLYHLLFLFSMLSSGYLKQVFLERFWRKLKGHFFKSSGYLGCCTKSTPITAVDEPSKGLKIQGRIVEKPALCNDLWSTSTCEMDNSGMHSIRSISSVSMSAQVQDRRGMASTSNSFEYVNHGLLLWNQTRQQWAGSKKPDNHTRKIQKPVLSSNTTYEGLLLNNKSFQKHIPLSEMNDFLAKVWEQEGLYD